MSDGTPDFTGALDLDRDAPNPYARDFQKDHLTCAEIEQITFAYYAYVNKHLGKAYPVNSAICDLAAKFKMPLGIIRSVVESVALSSQERQIQKLIETLQKCLGPLKESYGPLHAEVLTVLEKYQ